MIAELRKSQDHQQREVYREQQTKWDRFRQTRKYYIELYIKLRRKQKRVDEIIRYVKTRQAMVQVYQAYDDLRLKKLRMQRQIFLNFKFSIVWKRRARKWGGGLWEIHQGRIKRTFTLTTQCMRKRQEEKCRMILLPFLKQNADHDKTKSRVRYFFDRITFMQKRMKDKLVCMGSKVDVLMTYWEKLEFQIMTGAAPNAAKGRPMDEEAQQYAVKFHRVPAEVRRACLAEYVLRCRHLHSICFLQWRRMYPSELRYEEELLDQVLADAITLVKDNNLMNNKVKEEHLP